MPESQRETAKTLSMVLVLNQHNGHQCPDEYVALRALLTAQTNKLIASYGRTPEQLAELDITADQDVSLIVQAENERLTAENKRLGDQYDGTVAGLTEAIEKIRAELGQEVAHLRLQLADAQGVAKAEKRTWDAEHARHAAALQKADGLILEQANALQHAVDNRHFDRNDKAVPQGLHQSWAAFDSMAQALGFTQKVQPASLSVGGE